MRCILFTECDKLENCAAGEKQPNSSLEVIKGSERDNSRIASESASVAKIRSKLETNIEKSKEQLKQGYYSSLTRKVVLQILHNRGSENAQSTVPEKEVQKIINTVMAALLK